MPEEFRKYITAPFSIRFVQPVFRYNPSDGRKNRTENMKHKHFRLM
jgi:hypothetical protein